MSRFFSVSGWIVGIIGLILTIWQLYDGKQIARISYKMDTHPVYQKSSFNTSLFIGDGGPFKINEDIHETHFEVWNSGNISLKNEDIRKELLFSNIVSDAKDGSVGGIINFEAVEQRSPLNPNFVGSLDGTQLKYTWKLFDPGMGFKFRILHTGSPKDIYVSGNFGPKSEIADAVKSNSIVSAVSNGVFLLIGMFFITIRSEIVEYYTSQSLRSKFPEDFPNDRKSTRFKYYTEHQKYKSLRSRYNAISWIIALFCAYLTYVISRALFVYFPS